MAGIIDKILAARDVINQGETLSNPDVWARNTARTGALVILIEALLKFVPNGETIDHATVEMLANGIGAGYIIFTAFVHVASHKEVGLSPKRKS